MPFFSFFNAFAAHLKAGRSGLSAILKHRIVVSMLSFCVLSLKVSHAQGLLFTFIFCAARWPIAFLKCLTFFQVRLALRLIAPCTSCPQQKSRRPLQGTPALLLCLSTMLICCCEYWPAPYIPCVYNDVHFELELSGQLTDAGCPEKGWCAPPHQQKDQSVIYYP